jgi:DNA-binding MarR family transcriptional regulator
MEQHATADDFAEEVRGACLGMRVGRLHRVVARFYEQALQTVGLTQPQLEILVTLMLAEGPMRPAALAAELMLERSTISRNLALLQKRSWVSVAETSATGRAMSVTISEAGTVALTSTGTVWRRAQADAAEMLGPDAAPKLDEWLGLDSAGRSSGAQTAVTKTTNPSESGRLPI